MASYNRVVIMGNLTRDPEHKQLSSGQAVCRLGLASNRQFKNRQSGDLVQEVCYIDVDVWGAQAESCRQYLQKGRAVLIEGRLKYDTWQDPEGKNRGKHSIVADRVVFLASGVNAEVDSAEEGATNGRSDNEVHMDAALSKQINEVKARTQVKMATASKQKKQEATGFDGQSSTAGKGFSDEPPFQDDLPF
jgi:single-strand DNA-binding protein